MKHVLMIATFVFASTLVVLSQIQSSRTEQKEKLNKRQVLPSPILGFKEQPDAPLRMLYSAAFAIANNSRTVEVELVPKSESEKQVCTYTAYCEEELADAPSGSVTVKQVHRVSSQESEPAIFRVQRDSKLTFWVGSVEFEDGATWQAKLP